MPPTIQFGTSGWRAVMAEEFTFANVRRAVEVIARYVRSMRAEGARVIVGRDPLGEAFAAEAADILAAHNNFPGSPHRRWPVWRRFGIYDGRNVTAPSTSPPRITLPSTTASSFQLLMERPPFPT